MCKMKIFVTILEKKLKTASGIYGNPTEIPKIRKSQFRALKSLNWGGAGGMVSFGNFARIASICVGFHLGTLHGHFFTKTLAKFEFLTLTSNNTCLNICYDWSPQGQW